jgi:hypothetical protein
MQFRFDLAQLHDCHSLPSERLDIDQSRHLAPRLSIPRLQFVAYAERMAGPLGSGPGDREQQPLYGTVTAEGFVVERTDRPAVAGMSKLPTLRSMATGEEKLANCRCKPSTQSDRMANARAADSAGDSSASSSALDKGPLAVEVINTPP